MSYGTVRLPPPDAGLYARWSCFAYAWSGDGMGLGMTGLGAVIMGPIPVAGLYAEGQPLWATAVLMFVATIALATLPALLVVRLRGVAVPGCAYSSNAPPWWPRDLEPDKTWRQFHAIREPVLQSAAGPLWWAFLTAMQAYAVSGSREHVKQAQERAERIASLRREQRQIDTARALQQAGRGVIDTDDLDRADHLLRALKELDRA